MKTVSIHDAKTNLSRLIEAAKKGESISIGAYGKEEVWLTTTRPKPTKVTVNKLELGTLKNKIKFAADAFSEEFDKEISASFEANQDAR